MRATELEEKTTKLGWHVDTWGQEGLLLLCALLPQWFKSVQKNHKLFHVLLLLFVNSWNFSIESARQDPTVFLSPFVRLET